MSEKNRLIPLAQAQAEIAEVFERALAETAVKMARLRYLAD